MRGSKAHAGTWGQDEASLIPWWSSIPPLLRHAQFAAIGTDAALAALLSFRNCLNYTSTDPALRNSVSGMNCMGAGAPYPAGSCDSVTTWNASSPTPCTTFDTFGKVQQGVCDSNKLCYYTNVGYTDVIAEINNILDAFLKNSCINNLQALNSYYDTTAMAAYAQASLVKLQLVLLGAVDGSVGDINQYAASVADWMAARLAYNLDYQRQYNFVESLSWSDSYSIDGKATFSEAPADGRCTRMDYLCVGLSLLVTFHPTPCSHLEISCYIQIDPLPLPKSSTFLFFSRLSCPRQPTSPLPVPSQLDGGHVLQGEALHA
jgi:hypothetical protein